MEAERKREGYFVLILGWRVASMETRRQNLSTSVGSGVSAGVGDATSASRVGSACSTFSVFLASSVSAAFSSAASLSSSSTGWSRTSNLNASVT